MPHTAMHCSNSKRSAGQLLAVCIWAYQFLLPSKAPRVLSIQQYSKSCNADGSGRPTPSQRECWAAHLQSQHVLNKMPHLFQQTSFSPPQGRARRSPPCLLMGQRVRHPGGVPAPLQVQLSSANGAAPAPLPPGPAAKGGEGGGDVPAVVARGEGSAVPSGFVCRARAAMAHCGVPRAALAAHRSHRASNPTGPVRGTARCPFARPLVAAEARHGPVLMSPRPHSTTVGTAQSRGAGTRLAAAHGSVLAAPAVPSALRFEVLWGTRRAVPEPSLHTHAPVAGSAKRFSSDVPQKEPMDAWELSQAKERCPGSGLPRPYCSAPAPASFLPHSTQPPLRPLFMFFPLSFGLHGTKGALLPTPSSPPPLVWQVCVIIKTLEVMVVWKLKNDSREPDAAHWWITRALCRGSCAI